MMHSVSKHDRIASVVLALVSVFIVVVPHSNVFAETNPEPQYSATVLASPIRAIHFVTLGVPTSQMKRLIDKAAAARFNVVILGLGWRGSAKLHATPWADHPQAWTRDDITDIANYARNKSLEVVPHILLLTKQHVFLGEPYPEVLYNLKTYDPSNERVYELVFPILDEIIELIQPAAIHIGHDELYGSPNRSKHWKEGEKLLPGELFLLDVVRIHDFLTARNVETWMWGDMLLAADEFPNMNKVALLGGIADYGAELRKRLPKDIVICDWHYRDEGQNFRTIDVLRDDGFRVLGATWKKEITIRDFSRYAATHGASGMIATTWYHAREKGGDMVVQKIINASGEAFLRAFPDGE